MSFLKNLFGSRSTPEKNKPSENGPKSDRPSSTQRRQDRASGKKTEQKTGQNTSQKNGYSRKGQSKQRSQKQNKPKFTPPTPPALETIGFFGELDPPDELTSAISALGFTDATPVQRDVLPHSLAGEDIIAQAQTGTGKTAAFLISRLTYHL